MGSGRIIVAVGHPLMISAAALQGASLRKTGRPAVEDTASNRFASAAQEEKQAHARLRAVDLESWYDRLKDHTFATVFLSISPEEATAMMALYWERKAKELSTQTRTAVPTEQDRLHVHAVQDRVTQGIADLQRETSGSAGAVSGVFAKLSSRSPKDSRVCEKKALRDVLAQLDEVLSRGAGIGTNDVAVATTRSSVASLRCTTAQEVMDALLTSDRVCEDDLPLALQFPAMWSQHIVLRQWVEIPTGYEFRGFVYNNELTALSQYFKNAFFPDLVSRKQDILRVIMDEWHQVRDKVGLTPAEYVIDFAVDMSIPRAYVIELNPFGRPDARGTGTCLFNIRSPADAAVLFGERPFEFRLEDGPSTTPLQELVHEGPLKEYLKSKGAL